MTAEILPIRKPAKKFQDVPGVSFLKLDSETGIYYVRKSRVGKKDLFKSTGERTKGRAKTRAEDMIAEWLGNKLPQASRNPTLASVCAPLLEALRKDAENNDRRRETLVKDENMIPRIEKLFGDRILSEIDEEYWSEWVRSTGRSMKIDLFDIAKYLSKVLTYAYQQKLIGRKPTIKNPDKKTKKKRVISSDEMAEVLAHADEVLLLQDTLGYECGLRTGEVRGLHWEWIKFQNDGLAVLSLPAWFVKANARTIQLSPSASERLRKRRAVSKSPFVFPAPKNPMKEWESRKVQNSRWRKALAAARAQAIKEGREPLREGIRFTDLRHTFYTRTLLELKLPIQQVSQYGGTSIRTLQKVYLDGDASLTKDVASALQLPAIRGKSVTKETDNG